MKLKKVFFLLLVFSFINNIIYSQANSASTDFSDENSISISTTVQNDQEQKYKINSEDSEETRKSNPFSLGSLVSMILVLALIIAVIYFVMNFFKKSINGNGKKDDPYLRKVAHLNLGPGKSVQVVTILDNCYVLGVSDSGINLISELDDKELVSAMNVSADKAAKTSKAKNFAEVLEMFLPSKSTKTTSATKTNIYSESTDNFQDFVKTQRKRMNKKDS